MRIQRRNVHDSSCHGSHKDKVEISFLLQFDGELQSFFRIDFQKSLYYNRREDGNVLTHKRLYQSMRESR